MAGRGRTVDELMAPLETANEGEIEIEDEEEEPLKIARDPRLPPPGEVEGHRCTHYPYRSWCKFCVMGRGRGDPHRLKGDSMIPIVGLDYFFTTRGGAKKRSYCSSSTRATPTATRPSRRPGGAARSSSAWS